MRWKPLAIGAASFVPGLLRLARGRDATRGSDDPRYCYSVWLRHLVQIAESTGRNEFETVAELGPGDSLGCLLMALLCGSRRALALDVVRYAPTARNLHLLDSLVTLLRARADVPGDDEFPQIHPKLEQWRFPRRWLDDKRLGDALDPERIASIRKAVVGRPNAHRIEVDYRVPWQGRLEPESVDLVFSQACLEHVEPVEAAWDAMARGLRPGGVVSHQIDFKSHRVTPEWDGHRAYPDWAWRIVRGGRPYLLNRAPLSAQLAWAERHFELTRLRCVLRDPELEPRALARRFRGLDERDRRCAGAFVVGTRRARRARAGDTRKEAPWPPS